MAQYVDDPLLPNLPVTDIWYTVSAQEEISQVPSSSSNPLGRVPINAPSKRVSWKNEVHWVIKVYGKINGVATRLNCDKWSVVGLTPESQAEVSAVATVGAYIQEINGATPTIFGTTNEVRVGMTALAPNTLLKPLFRVKANPGALGTNNPATFVEVFPFNDGKDISTIYFTEGNVDPQIPPSVKADSVTGGLTDYITYDDCIKPAQWVNISAKIKDGVYNYYINRYSILGVLQSSKFIGKGSDGSKKAKNEIFKLRSINCDQYSGQTDPGGDTTIDPPPAIGGIFFNPPNHPALRALPHGERMLDSLLSKGAVVVDPAAVKKNLFNRLGKIYQSDDGAKSLNIPDKNGKLTVYGFRFHYNPTSIQYGTTTNTSIDWLLNSTDPANLLGGNTVVEVELLLNRILDMTALKSGKPATYGGVKLGEEDVKGILNRGTEYDLEFLYRCLNGDPEEKNYLLSYPGKTADFGYITGTPLWFHFHDSMRYYGSVSSLNVTHKIFNSNMVPMLSTVKITFIRYPSITGLPQEVIKALEARAKAIVNTAKEPKP